MIGDVEWGYGWNDKEKKYTPYATNKGTEPVGFSYSASRFVGGADSTATDYFVLPDDRGQNTFNPTRDLVNYKDGELTLAPTVNPDGLVSGLERAITFAIRSLSLGAVAAVTGGVDLSVRRDTDGRYSASITFPGPLFSFMRGRVTVRDENGRTVTASAETRTGAESGGAQAEETLMFDLPEGIDLDPLVPYLYLELQVEEQAFRAVTANNTRPLMAGPLPRRRPDA